MKTYNYRSRTAIIALIVCGLFLSSYSVSQAKSNAQSHRVASSASEQSVSAPARLIVRRIPNLGNGVFVDLYLDGAPLAAVGYGQTYEGLLLPGRHVLSVRVAPRPKWKTEQKTPLDVRSGETYTFTAMGNGSGELILNED